MSRKSCILCYVTVQNENYATYSKTGYIFESSIKTYSPRKNFIALGYRLKKLFFLERFPLNQCCGIATLELE